MFQQLTEENVIGIIKAQRPKLNGGKDSINNKKKLKKCCKELAEPMSKTETNQ